MHLPYLIGSEYSVKTVLEIAFYCSNPKYLMKDCLTDMTHLIVQEGGLVSILLCIEFSTE